MKMRAIFLAAVAAPLIAATPAPPIASVAAPKTTEPAKGMDVVCKKFDPPTGSRIGKRQICRTQAEWDLLKEQDREVIDRALRKPLDGQ